MFRISSPYAKAGVLSSLLILGEIGGVCLWASSGQEEASYLRDQKIDQEMKLLDKPWERITLVNIYSRFDLPLEVRPGFPPYDQEVERAQDFSTRPIPSNCHRDPKTNQLVCT